MAGASSSLSLKSRLVRRERSEKMSAGRLPISFSLRSRLLRVESPSKSPDWTDEMSRLSRRSELISARCVSVMSSQASTPATFATIASAISFVLAHTPPALARLTTTV